MIWLRRLLWVLLILAIIYSVLWVAGLFVIQFALDRIKPAPLSELDALLAEEMGEDSLRFDFEDRSVSGYPFGYTITLERPSVEHTLVSWQAEDAVTARWFVFRPFSVSLDYSGTHRLNAVLQPPVQISTDKGTARVRLQPMMATREARLSLVQVGGQAVRLNLRDRPVLDIDRFAVALDIREESEPGDLMLDIFGFALSDDDQVQSRYQEMLLSLGNVEATLSTLGLGLDRPVDHLRVRTTIAPFFPLSGTNLVLRSFISRGGNALVEVMDIQQGSWRARMSARAMFGPDGRLIAQTCPLLRAGASYLPIPFMSVISLYQSAGGLDISREPIPDFALPKSIEPFTQRELCDVARTYVFDDETT